MCDKGINLPFTANTAKDTLNRTEGFKHTITAFNIFPILRDFFGKVSICHHFVIAENIRIDKAITCVCFAVFINNGKAKVIDKRAINIVCGFSVKNDVLFHLDLFLSQFLYIIYHRNDQIARWQITQRFKREMWFLCASRRRRPGTQL